VSWRGLRYKGTERLTSREWNVVVDALNDLYGFLTGGLQDIYVREVYGHSGYFNTRVYCEGRPVILDGDPISIYQFYDIAKSQITEAIDKSSQLAKIVSGLDQIYGKLPSKDDITSAINNARVTSNTDLIAQYTGSSKALLEQLYGKLPSKEDVTSAIDSALVTWYSLDIREYSRRVAEASEAQLPKLDLITQYTKESRDVLVRLSINEYGNVGVRIAEPLDEYGRVVVSTPKELLDEFKPVSVSGSIYATDNTAGFSVVLNKGGRPNVNVYYSLGGAGTVYLKVSTDGATWRTLKTYTLASAGEGVDIIQGVAYPYVKLETPTTGIDVEFEIVASR
jgi:hypothetical protein